MAGKSELHGCSQSSFLLALPEVLVTQTGRHHGHWIKDRGWCEASGWQMREIMEGGLVVTAWFQCQYVPGKAAPRLGGLQHATYAFIDPRKQLWILDLIWQRGTVTAGQQIKIQINIPAWKSTERKWKNKNKKPVGIVTKLIHTSILQRKQRAAIYQQSAIKCLQQHLVSQHGLVNNHRRGSAAPLSWKSFAYFHKFDEIWVMSSKACVSSACPVNPWTLASDMCCCHYCQT